MMPTAGVPIIGSKATEIQHPTVNMTRFALLQVRLVALTSVLALYGCVSASYTFGTLPNLGALEQDLIICVSDQAEILRVLGEPSGRGMEMLPISDRPRTTWTYHYMRGSLKDARRLVLFVFLKEGKYDGYMWFSSLPESTNNKGE